MFSFIMVLRKVNDFRLQNFVMNSSQILTFNAKAHKTLRNTPVLTRNVPWPIALILGIFSVK